VAERGAERERGRAQVNRSRGPVGALQRAGRREKKGGRREKEREGEGKEKENGKKENKERRRKGKRKEKWREGGAGIALTRRGPGRPRAAVARDECRRDSRRGLRLVGHARVAHRGGWDNGCSGRRNDLGIWV